MSSRGQEWSQEAHIGRNIFSFKDIGSDPVLDRLSESEIDISIRAACSRKWAKYDKKNLKKKCLAKKLQSVSLSILTPVALFYIGTETFYRQK